MILKLSAVPPHGLVWFSIPKGSGFRAAVLTDGSPLPAQFLPAAHENASIEGLLLVRLPAETAVIHLKQADCPAVPGDTFAYKTSNYLVVETAEGPITLEDSLGSSQLCQEGTYRIFGENIHTVGFSGPLFDATRVLSVPANATGLTLDEVEACYDFIRLKDLPLLQTFTSFRCKNAWPVNTLDIFQMQLKKDSFHSWAAGKPACGGSFEKDAETGLVPILQPTHVIGNVVKSYDIMFEHYMSVCGENGSFALVGGEMHAAYNEPHRDLGPDYWTIGHHHITGEFDLSVCNAANPILTNLILGEAANAPAEWLVKLPPVIQPEEDTADAVFLEAGDLKISLYSTGCGVRLNGLWDTKTGRRWLKNGTSPLFRVVLRDVNTRKNLLVSSLEGWEQVTLGKTASGAEMTLAGAKIAPGVSITMRAELLPELHEIAWSGEATVDSDTLTLVEFDYPQLSFDAPASFSLATPYQSGKLYPDMALSSMTWNNEYSNLWCPMQMLTMWDAAERRGLYYAVEDPEPYAKRVKLHKLFSGRGSMGIALLGVNAGIAGNSLKLTGRAVWRLYDGDWYNAALFYRSWVRARATWMPRLNEKGRRADQPDWIYDIGLWTMASPSKEPTDAWADDAIALQERTGVPVTVHLYNWHKIPFDTCYPHYFPVKESTPLGIAKLHKAGIRVMPYITGRLWDIDDDHTALYTGEAPTRTFQNYGYRSATTNWHNEIIEERYGSKHPDGTLVRLNGACLTQPSWHAIVRELCDRMYQEVGVDGVYLDQMSGSGFGLCCNPEHGHPIGIGGKWWMEGCNAMMKQVREITPEYGFYTSEENAEVFANLLQGQLVWHWSSGSLLPIYSIVYSDVIALFGRNYPTARPMTRWDRWYHRITFSESLTFGDQLAWNTNFLRAPGQKQEDLDFYYKAIALRYQHREYFQHGLLLHPPVITCAEPELVVQQTTDYNASALHGGPIAASMWQHECDGSMLLTVVNITDKELPFELSLEHTCSLPDGEITFEGTVSGTVQVKNGKIDLQLPPLSVIMAVIPAK